MVSSNGSFEWIDKSDHHWLAHSAGRTHDTLWLTDDNPCVDQLLSKIDALFGDPVVRVPNEMFDRPREIASLIKTATNVGQMDNIIVLGHSHFLSRRQLSQIERQFADNRADDPLTLRMSRRHHWNQLAKQRLLDAAAELSQMSGIFKQAMTDDLLITPLFLRVEDDAVCHFNETTMQFEAIEIKLALGPSNHPMI